ncbi:Wzz/FepE/Etk N-terminal domain-containing protein [Pseudomonadota bacterium]
MAGDNEKQSRQQELPPMDPRLMAAMYGMQDEDEIDLLAYWRLIWGERKLILSIAFAAALLAVVYSLTLPNIYRAEVLLAPVKAEESRSGLASALGGLGGLASMAGISIGGGGSVEENLAVLKSREFLWKFIKDQKLMPVLFEDDWDAELGKWEESDPEDQPSLWDASREFDAVMSVSRDKKSDLITVGVEWRDPALAAAWANALVMRVNEHLRQQAIARSNSSLKYLREELMRTQIEEMRQALFELITKEQGKAMLANTRKEFAFQVLDRAVEPDRKAKPKRSLIVVLAAFIAGFLAVVFVLIREGVENRKEAEEGVS